MGSPRTSRTLITPSLPRPSFDLTPTGDVAHVTHSREEVRSTSGIAGELLAGTNAIIPTRSGEGDTMTQTLQGDTHCEYCGASYMTFHEWVDYMEGRYFAACSNGKCDAYGEDVGTCDGSEYDGPPDGRCQPGRPQ